MAYFGDRKRDFQSQRMQDVTCLKCGATIAPEDSECSVCGNTFESVKLYEPQHFIPLSIFLSPMVPIFMTASNWGRLGDPVRRRRWLLLGSLCFVGLLLLYGLLPDVPGGNLLAMIPHAMIGWGLRERQRIPVAAARSLGAGHASTFSGAVRGLGVTILVSGLAVGLFMAGYVGWWNWQEQRGLALMEEGRYAESVEIWERLAREPDAEGYLHFNVGLCYLHLEQWPESAGAFRYYLRGASKDSDAHALLWFVLDRQGKEEEAEEHYETALQLDPEVMGRWFEQSE